MKCFLSIDPAYISPLISRTKQSSVWYSVGLFTGLICDRPVAQLGCPSFVPFCRLHVGPLQKSSFTLWCLTINNTSANHCRHQYKSPRSKKRKKFVLIGSTEPFQSGAGEWDKSRGCLWKLRFASSSPPPFRFT